ncbi:MAG: hypothetical protein C5B50_22715 [Verrucomicrobia bacterium]|nr:MAG: hypothetical protein C5B50_22715 [Verrucomicrobiota bacterium]
MCMKLENCFPTPLLMAAFSITLASEIRGQTYVVDAQLMGQSDAGSYDYTLTLNNRAASTTQIGTFWFAWTASGLDLMLSAPTATQTPAGWSASVLGGPYTQNGYGYYDGYSIEFTTTTGYLNPGSSLTFNFSSPDSPTMMSGNNFHFHTAIETSWVYSGAAFSDAGNQFLVQTVPEPSGLGLLLLVGSGLMLGSSRRRGW